MFTFCDYATMVGGEVLGSAINVLTLATVRGHDAPGKYYTARPTSQINIRTETPTTRLYDCRLGTQEGCPPSFPTGVV